MCMQEVWGGLKNRKTILWNIFLFESGFNSLGFKIDPLSHASELFLWLFFYQNHYQSFFLTKNLIFSKKCDFQQMKRIVNKLKKHVEKACCKKEKKKENNP